MRPSGWKRRLIRLLVLVLTAGALAAGTVDSGLNSAEAFATPDGADAAVASKSGQPGAPEQRCGKKYLFGRPFSIEVAGKRIKCKNVRRIVASGCRIRLKQKWSCVSFRETKPFLVWFLTAEIFKPRWTTTIRFRRYPCSEAHVTPSLFKHLGKSFPTRRQMLADDLIRCEMLADASTQEVESAIGPPDERAHKRGHTYLYYLLGPERDSLFQIDSELFAVEVSGEKVKALSIVQD
jgi:hypothetical protein